MTIYCKKITAEQRAWLKMYESQTGFEPLYQEDIDTGDKTFYEAARENVLWYEMHTLEVYLHIQKNIPGESEALEDMLEG